MEVAALAGGPPRTAGVTKLADRLARAYPVGMIGHEDQQRLRPWLFPGERVLWTGRPKRGFTVELGDLWAPALLAAWLAANLLLDYRPEDWPLDPMTFGLGLGVLFVVGARLYEPWLRRHLLYAVTDKRVVILSGGLRPDVHSRDLAWLPKLDLEQQRPDRGNIVIAGNSSVRWSLFPKDWETEISEEFRFCRIENPRAVYDLICRASRDRSLELNREPATDFLG